MQGKYFIDTDALWYHKEKPCCYHAVVCVFSSEDDYAERRKLVIQESKYLGGDMEHTHLVKGLDYALLEKVWRTCLF